MYERCGESSTRGTVLTLSYLVDRVHLPLPFPPRSETMAESTSSTSSSDIECMIEDLFDDDHDGMTDLLPAAISVVLTEKHGRPYPGRLAGSSSFNRGCCSWFEDYLSDVHIYSSTKCRKVFHIPLKLYWALHDELLLQDPSLTQHRDASGKAGHSSHQKILCSLHRLGSGVSFEQPDDMSRMSPESQQI